MGSKQLVWPTLVPIFSGSGSGSAYVGASWLCFETLMSSARNMVDVWDM